MSDPSVQIATSTQTIDIFTTGPEFLSLALILASLLIVAFLAYRSKTTKSFQFQMFVVLLVIAAAEVPHMLMSVGLLDLSYIEDFGLFVHTASMIFLVGFISFRVSRLYKGRTAR